MERNEAYWQRVREWAAQNDSDGCTLVADIYLDCCYEHDKAYRDGTDMDGNPISRRAADRQLRRCIQSRSKLGLASPISWIRWFGVRIGGLFLWRHD